MKRFKRFLENELKSLCWCIRDLILLCLPNDWCVDRYLRPFVLRRLGMEIGHDCTICKAFYYGSVRNIKIGSNAYIQRQVFFHAGGKIIIGNGVGIGCQSTLITGTHKMGQATSRWQGELIRKDIVVEDGVWIGARVFIGPGVTIGAGSVVAAGAVVVRSVPKNTIVGGVPAKVIKTLEV